MVLLPKNTVRTIASLTKTCIALGFLSEHQEHEILLFLKAKCFPKSFLLLQHLCYLAYDINARNSLMNFLSQYLKTNTICNFIT